MTRQIKFRAWDNGNKRMLFFGRLAWMDEYNVLYFSDGVLDVPFENNMNLMQYTGLKDKNGKEIYEGDICKWPSGAIYQIIWDEVNACFSTPLYKWQVEKGFQTIIGTHLEIIGNIYENPELIK